MPSSPWVLSPQHLTPPVVVSAQKESYGCYCAGLAHYHAKGPKDPADSATYFRKACDLDYAEGCDALGFNYLKGIGVPKDAAHALHRYEAGEGVARDLKRAAELYSKGCDLDDADSCVYFGMLTEAGTGVPRDDAAAAQIYSKGCDLGSGYACLDLGRLYEKGSGVSRDDEKAKDFYKRGCDKGVADSCTRLGDVGASAP